MYLAKNFTGRSDAEIGRRFGGRDPSTVHDARYKVQRRRILDQELDQAIFELTAVLSSPSTLKEGK
jgi:chromosomal replication initiation ATPase DnaA